MKYFAVVFAAVMALSIATPVEVEERQGDIINMIINMLKGFICNMQEVEVRSLLNKQFLRMCGIRLPYFWLDLMLEHSGFRRFRFDQKKIFCLGNSNTILQVEERQMDIINMIINMVKGFLC